MATTDDKQAQVKKLRELIEDIKIAMLTTEHDDGRLRSRPMMAIKMDEAGCLWFFTNRDGEKSEAIREKCDVNLSYSNPEKEKYVSVSGDAQLVNDRVKIKELWSPFVKSWFPKGVDDPNLVLLKVDITSAQYWDVKSSTLVELVGYVKATLSGETFGKSKAEELLASSKRLTREDIQQHTH